MINREASERMQSMLDTYNENKDFYELQRSKIGFDNFSDNKDDDIDLLTYHYRLVKKGSPKASSKKVPIKIALWKDDRGRVFVDLNTYSLLRDDRRLFIQTNNAKLEYRDNLSREPSTVNLLTLDEVEAADINSILAIYKILDNLKKDTNLHLSSQEKINEAVNYLKYFLNKNNINNIK